MYLIGYILKPQGIKGEIKINSVSPDLDRYKKLDKVYISKDNKRQIFPLEYVRIAGGFVFLKLIGVDSRTEAEQLREAEVQIAEKDLLTPGKNEYFIHDLVGCRVFSEQGILIGKLTEVVQLNSNDIYVLSDSSGKEILIPAIRDVIRKVDIKNKRITVHMLEGLAD
jgi:16S rRNA processing protein RimM